MDKFEDTRIKEKISLINALDQAVSNIVNRHRRQKDPVIRSTLLFDKLCTILDLFVVAAMSVNHDLPEESKQQCQKIVQILQEELNYVYDWISSPSYSPDHPFGNNLMSSCFQKYVEKAEVYDKRESQ